MTITITLREDDAEPILRKAAYEAAKWGAFLDHIMSGTRNAPLGHGETLEEARVRWKASFFAAKRIVEAFGIDCQWTSEEETLTVTYDMVGGKKVNRGFFTEIVGSKLDFKHPKPCYRREVHSYACHAAADRTVQAWKKR